MSAIERSEIISTTQSSRPSEPNCPISETALQVIKVVGLILIGAGAVGFFAGLQAPGIALLVMGAVALILGFTLKASLEAPASNLSEELMATIRAVPAPAQVRDVDVVGLTASMRGASRGGLLGEALINQFKVRDGLEARPSTVSEVAILVAQAIKKQREHPDRSLESVFEELIRESGLRTIVGEGMLGGLQERLQGDLGGEAEILAISVVGAIYYSDLAAVVETSLLLAKAYAEAIAYNPINRGWIWEPRSISATVALSVAVALLVRGNSIEEATTHALNIGQRVLFEKMSQGDYTDFQSKYDEFAEKLRGSIEDDDSVKDDSTLKGSCLTYFILNAAFSALRKPKDLFFRDAIEKASGRCGSMAKYYNNANAFAAGILLGASDPIGLILDLRTPSHYTQTDIMWHSNLVAQLSGAFNRDELTAIYEMNAN